MAKKPVSNEIEVKLKWQEQPRQLTFLRACGLSHPFDHGDPGVPAAKIIGYGGSAGGGKSDALIVAGIIAALTHTGCRVGYFRRKFTQLEGPGGAVMRSHELLSSSLGSRAYNAQKRRWTFPGGSILQFCYLDREEDVYNYQSQQFDVLLFDEATQFTWTQIAYMQTRIRSSKTGITTFTAMATNPGNIGHYWFKKNFVQAGEPEVAHNVEVEEGKFATHMFIPAKLSDNMVLEKRDPSYRQNLENQPEILRKQLLDGDWDIAEGVAFTEWREPIHICTPFDIPDEWTRFRSCDWGYSKPYSIGWYCVDFDGRIYKYRELYGYGGRPDVGSKEDPEDVARKIIELEKGENIRYAVADDAIFGSRQDNSPSIAEQFADAFGYHATHWQPVGKGPRSRISGKIEFHHRLKWDKDEEGKWNGELPMIVFFNNCRHSIRTIPNLILDQNNPEDVDTTLEDHIYDETRYACMSHPITPRSKKKEESEIEKYKRKLAQRRVVRRII